MPGTVVGLFRTRSEAETDPWKTQAGWVRARPGFGVHTRRSAARATTGERLSDYFPGQ